MRVGFQIIVFRLERLGSTSMDNRVYKPYRATGSFFCYFLLWGPTLPPRFVLVINIVLICCCFFFLSCTKSYLRQIQMVASSDDLPCFALGSWFFLRSHSNWLPNVGWGFLDQRRKQGQLSGELPVAVLSCAIPTAPLFEFFHWQLVLPINWFVPPPSLLSLCDCRQRTQKWRCLQVMSRDW